jgi:hypothetical protein
MRSSGQDLTAGELLLLQSFIHPPPILRHIAHITPDSDIAEAEFVSAWLGERKLAIKASALGELVDEEAQFTERGEGFSF